jgi:hypothetical protein
MTDPKAVQNETPPKKPKLTQEAPTKAAPRDERGFELDDWGLPVSGPIRAIKLEEIGKPDPNVDPAAWEEKKNG